MGKACAVVETGRCGSRNGELSLLKSSVASNVTTGFCTAGLAWLKTHKKRCHLGVANVGLVYLPWELRCCSTWQDYAEILIAFQCISMLAFRNDLYSNVKILVGNVRLKVLWCVSRLLYVAGLVSF